MLLAYPTTATSVCFLLDYFDMLTLCKGLGTISLQSALNLVGKYPEKFAFTQLMGTFAGNFPSGFSALWRDIVP
jgi:hypothetical protein